jgi:hypothetical protein
MNEREYRRPVNAAAHGYDVKDRDDNLTPPAKLLYEFSHVVIGVEEPRDGRGGHGLRVRGLARPPSIHSPHSPCRHTEERNP